MNDIVDVKLIGVVMSFITPDQARSAGVDVAEGVDSVEEYTLRYAVYEEDKFDNALRVEVHAYFDELGGYYLHETTVHGDFDPGDAKLAKELIEGLFIRKHEHEIFCDIPITISIGKMQRV